MNVYIRHCGTPPLYHFIFSFFSFPTVFRFLFFSFPLLFPFTPQRYAVCTPPPTHFCTSMHLTLSYFGHLARAPLDIRHFGILAFQGVVDSPPGMVCIHPCESVTLATVAFFVWTINCNLTLTLTLFRKDKTRPTVHLKLQGQAL